jgi:polysaccharide biosynthesis transport protein
MASPNPAAANTASVSVSPYTYTVMPSEGVGGADGDAIRLGELRKILQRRKRVLLITLLAVTAASTAWLGYQRLVHPVYEGHFRMLITDPVSPTGGAGANQAGDSPIAAVALNRSQQDLPTLIQVLESPVVLAPVRQQLAQRWPNERTPAITVTPSSGGRGQQSTGVLNVELTSSDRAMLKQALEFTEAAYLNFALQQRRERLQEAVRFLDEQAPELQAKANAIQGRVQAFRLQHRLLQPETEAMATRGQVEELRSQLISQQSELGRLERLRSEVSAGNLVTHSVTSQSSDGIAGVTNSGSSGTNVQFTVPDQAELAELANLDIQLADARSRYVVGAPILRQLEAARASLVPQIQTKQLTAISSALGQYRNTISTTQNQITQLEGRFESQPGLLREYANLEQQLKIAEGNLLSYLNAREQFQLEIAQNTEPWKVIAPAVVGGNPVAPNVGRGFLQALLLGAAAGLGAALLRERFDHVFHSTDEVSDELGETLLGHVPYIQLFEGVRQDKRFMLEALDQPGEGSEAYQRFHYQEAFRNLATSLRFLNSDRPLRSIALTSSVPAEGKSLIGVLLAKTLSELGQRVLLVDADLRKPQLHHGLGLDNLTGLSDLLTDEGDDKDWRTVVQAVPNASGWDVITAGRTPPDPPRLLSSKRMGHLVEAIAGSGSYDLIIYDTPPALGLADAALVAEQLDGLIMLVSLSRVERNLPKEAISRIRQAGAPVLGLVTNARKPRREGGETTRYAYGYGGYGYGGYANDPAMAYAYYNKSGSEPEVPVQPSRWQTLTPSRDNLRRWRHRLTRWLDG